MRSTVNTKRFLATCPDVVSQVKILSRVVTESAATIFTVTCEQSSRSFRAQESTFLRDSTNRLYASQFVRNPSFTNFKCELHFHLVVEQIVDNRESCKRDRSTVGSSTMRDSIIKKVVILIACRDLFVMEKKKY